MNPHAPRKFLPLDPPSPLEFPVTCCAGITHSRTLFFFRKDAPLTLAYMLLLCTTLKNKPVPQFTRSNFLEKFFCYVYNQAVKKI